MEEETKQLLQEYQQHVVYKEIVLEIYLPPRCRQEGWSLRRLLKEHTDAINNPNHANWTLIDEEMQKLEEYFRRNPEIIDRAKLEAQFRRNQAVRIRYKNRARLLNGLCWHQGAYSRKDLDQWLCNSITAGLSSRWSMDPWSKIVEQTEVDSVYRFPLFGIEFCTKLIAVSNELASYRNWREEGFKTTEYSPSTLRDFILHDRRAREPSATPGLHGVYLNRAGSFPTLVNDLVREIFNPICSRYGPWKNKKLKASAAFVVSFSAVEGSETHSEMHRDDSEVSINICLGMTELQNGALQFTVNDSTHCVEQKPGWAVIHPGGMAHGSQPMGYGIRHNLVIWCKYDTRQQHSDRKAQLDKDSATFHEFFQLPMELQYMILSYVDVFTLCQLSQCSTAMKSIADSETLWARFVPFDKHSLYPAKSRYTTIFLQKEMEKYNWQTLQDSLLVNVPDLCERRMLLDRDEEYTAFVRPKRDCLRCSVS